MRKGCITIYLHNSEKKISNIILKTDLLYIQKETITKIINKMYLHNHYPKVKTKIKDTLNTSGVLKFREQTQFII